jgi:hypothetical protein
VSGGDIALEVLGFGTSGSQGTMDPARDRNGDGAVSGGDIALTVGQFGESCIGL